MFKTELWYRSNQAGTSHGGSVGGCGPGLEQLLQQDVHVGGGVVVDVATEEVLHHLGADAVEGGQTHEEARVVHDVTLSRALHVLL